MSSGTNETKPANIFGAVDETHKPNGAQTTPVTETPDAAPRDPCQAIEKVLLASANPIDLAALSADINAEAGAEHIAEGVLVATLAEMKTLGRVAETETGTPPKKHYAMSEAAREELEAPGRVLESRAAVVGVLAGRTNYAPVERGQPPQVMSGLTAAEITHAIVASATNEAVAPLLDPDFRTSFIGERDATTKQGALRLIEQAKGILLILVGHGLATLVEEPGDDQAYKLSDAALKTFVVHGSLGVAQKTMPQKAPDVPWEEREGALNDAWAAQVSELQKRVLEAEKRRDTALQQTALYERWFREKHIDSPAEAVRADLGHKERSNHFTWSVTKEIEGAELIRLLDELGRLTEHHNNLVEKVANEHKQGKATCEFLSARIDTLMDMVTARGKRTITKLAWQRVIAVEEEGKTVHKREILSAEEHDLDTRLALEPIAAGTQLGIKGLADNSAVVADPVGATVKKAADTTTNGKSVSSSPVNQTKGVAEEAQGASPKNNSAVSAEQATTNGASAKEPQEPQESKRPVLSLSLKGARSFIVEHVLPKYPDGILLKEIPDAAFKIAGMNLSGDAYTSAFAMLTKAGQSAREKHLVDETITPDGPFYKLRKSEAAAPTGEVDEATTAGKGKRGGGRRGKAVAGTV